FRGGESFLLPHLQSCCCHYYRLCLSMCHDPLSLMRTIGMHRLLRARHVLWPGVVRRGYVDLRSGIGRTTRWLFACEVERRSSWAGLTRRQICCWMFCEALRTLCLRWRLWHWRGFGEQADRIAEACRTAALFVCRMKV